MAINVRKMADHGKVALLLVHVLAATGSQAAAQSAASQPPAVIGLAGAASARCGSEAWASVNPAGVDGITRAVAAAWFAPPAIGIAGVYDGGLLGAWPIDSARTAAIGIDGITAHGFRQLDVRVLVAARFTGGIVAGGALRFETLSIDHYGSAFAPAVDVGIIAHLTEHITAGIAVIDITRSTLGGLPRTQRIALGTAFTILPMMILSLDVTHELERPVDLALGCSTQALPSFTIHAGAGTAPGRLALGIAYDRTGWSFEYGGAFIMPVGLRHAVGVNLRW